MSEPRRTGIRWVQPGGEKRPIDLDSYGLALDRVAMKAARMQQATFSLTRSLEELETAQRNNERAKEHFKAVRVEYDLAVAELRDVESHGAVLEPFKSLPLPEEKK